MVIKKKLFKRKNKKMGTVIEKLIHFPEERRAEINCYLDELVKENKVNNINFSMVTTGGIWRICVDFKEEIDASEFLKRFWGMHYESKKK